MAVGESPDAPPVVRAPAPDITAVDGGPPPDGAPSQSPPGPGQNLQWTPPSEPKPKTDAPSLEFLTKMRGDKDFCDRVLMAFEKEYVEEHLPEFNRRWSDLHRRRVPPRPRRGQPR